MKIFISAGEPSGDLHGANLIRALRQLQPAVDIHAFGGERMAQAGCHMVYPLCNHAVMGLTAVLAELPRFIRILRLFARWLKEHKPDRVVLIDYPGLHWWLARIAHGQGIPVYYFVPPQIWAWATHRVKRMKKYVDRILCSLPFEPQWYAERGVQAEYIGHPYFDEMQRQKLDEGFLESQMAIGVPIVGVLPGSRNKEVSRNGPMLVQAMERLHAQRPDVRFLVAAYKPSQAITMERLVGSRLLPVEIHVGRTPEIIHLAHACVAVSGSVSLELLHHLTPTVIVYRIGKWLFPLVKRFKHVKYITLVNLLADQELFPEFLTAQCPDQAIASILLHWLNDEPARQQRIAALSQLREQVGQPGACQRAAAAILESGATDRHTRQVA